MSLSAPLFSPAATSGLTSGRAAISRAARARSCNARRSASLHPIGHSPSVAPGASGRPRDEGGYRGDRMRCHAPSRQATPPIQVAT